MKTKSTSLLATGAMLFACASTLSSANAHAAPSANDAHATRTAASTEASQKLQPFSPLTGAFAVGTTQFNWIDKSRREKYTSNPKVARMVVVQAWYPASKAEAASAEPAPYLLSPMEVLGDTEDAKKLTQYNQYVGTRSKLNVPMAKAAKAFPVLIFNPGGGNPRFTSSFAAEQLASHGFIVFAIEHHGDSMVTNYPDGTPLNFDRQPKWGDTRFLDRLAKGLASSNEILEQTLGDWAKRETEYWPVEVLDNQFVLKKIEELNRKSDTKNIFAGRMDLDKIGTFGWSMGGAHAIHLLVNDPRIKATVDFDGQFFGEKKASLKTNKPVMLLYGVNDPETDPQMKIASEALGKLVKSWSDHFMTHSTGPRYDLTIQGAQHGTFSDWHLFNAQIAAQKSKDSKEIEFAQKRERLISNLTVSFFKKYLAGETAEIPALDPLICRRRAHDVPVEHQADGSKNDCAEAKSGD